MDEIVITSKEQCEALKSEAETLDLFQKAVKVIINQIYGAFGNNNFYFCNYDIAESITLQGQDLIKFAIKICNHYMRNKWHVDYELHQHLGIDSSKITPITEDAVCYVDTDSNYVVFDYLIQSVENQKSFADDKEVAEFILDIYNFRFKDYLNHCFDEYGKFYNVNNRMKFKMEKISSRGIWVASKMYMYRVVFEDFFREQKTKASGLAATKPSFPKLAREILWKLMDVCLDKNYDLIIEKDLIPILTEELKRFKAAQIDDVSYNKKCNGISKYSVEKSGYHIVDAIGEKGNPIQVAVNNETELPHTIETKKGGVHVGEINGEIGEYYTFKGCTIDVKGCLWYNSMLMRSGNQKYNKIRSGQKIKMFYVKDEREKLAEGFCYTSGSYCEELSLNIDYEAQFNFAVLHPLNAILNAMNKQSIGHNLKRVISVKMSKKGDIKTMYPFCAINTQTLEYEEIPNPLVKYIISDKSLAEMWMNTKTFTDEEGKRLHAMYDNLLNELERIFGKYGDDVIVMPAKEVENYINTKVNAADKKANAELIKSLDTTCAEFYESVLKYLKEKYKFKVTYDSETKQTILSHKKSKKSIMITTEYILSLKCADTMLSDVLDYFDDLNQEDDGNGE